MAQWVRVFFAEDPARTSGGSQLPVTVAPRDLIPSFVICRQYIHVLSNPYINTHMYT